MSNKYTWDTFAEQSKFFWSFQQTIAFVEVAVFSGWYTLYTAEESMKELALGLLIFGIFILFTLFLIIKRASQYLDALRPEGLNVKPPFLGLRTSILGTAIPLALIVFNIILIVYTYLYCK